MENGEPLIIVNPVDHTVHKTPPVSISREDLANPEEQEVINDRISQQLTLAVRDPDQKRRIDALKAKGLYRSRGTQDTQPGSRLSGLSRQGSNAWDNLKRALSDSRLISYGSKLFQRQETEVQNQIQPEADLGMPLDDEDAEVILDDDIDGEEERKESLLPALNYSSSLLDEESYDIQTVDGSRLSELNNDTRLSTVSGMTAADTLKKDRNYFNPDYMSDDGDE